MKYFIYYCKKKKKTPTALSNKRNGSDKSLAGNRMIGKNIVRYNLVFDYK